MYERLLEPESTDVPTCRCRKDMRYDNLESRSADALVKIFRCDDCGHELRLMIWADTVLDTVGSGERGAEASSTQMR